MPKKAKLLLMRHGQTDYNKQRLMTGQRDVPLTKDGEEQARTIGRLVKDIHIDSAFSSPLKRAFNTAALALEAAGTQEHLHNADGTWQVEKRQAIIEADAGRFAGRNIDTDPEIVVFQRTYGVPMPEGESDKDVVARVQKFFDEEVVPLLKEGKNVMIVAHSGTIHAFDVVLGLMKTPKDNEKLATQRIPNAAPMVYEYEDGVMKSHYFIENPETTKAAKAANQNAPAAKPRKYRPEA